ncbi:MAG: hypothetical protein JWR73_1935 [Tardiphaga sp.]|nr:hypothetical protein [Tardiphaga sp.]
MTEHPSASIVPDSDPLYEIVGHLGAILIQADRDDDPIIIEHVRTAHQLAMDLYRRASRREHTHA